MGQDYMPGIRNNDKDAHLYRRRPPPRLVAAVVASAQERCGKPERKTKTTPTQHIVTRSKESDRAAECTRWSTPSALFVTAAASNMSGTTEALCQNGISTPNAQTWHPNIAINQAAFRMKPNSEQTIQASVPHLLLRTAQLLAQARDLGLVLHARRRRQGRKPGGRWKKTATNTAGSYDGPAAVKPVSTASRKDSQEQKPMGQTWTAARRRQPPSRLRRRRRHKRQPNQQHRSENTS